MSVKGGLWTVPPYTGHNPPRMRKREDLPQPLGPTTNRWSPGVSLKVRAGTRTSPLGEMMGLKRLVGGTKRKGGGGGGETYTSINSMLLLSTTLPLPLRTASLFSVPELDTSFFSKCPA